MKRLFFLFVISLAILSCQKEFHSNGFTFDRKVYEVDFEGGEITISYAMDGEYREPRISLGNSWATKVKQSRSSLTISVDKNFGKKRETKIYFENPRSGASAYVTVSQAAYKGKQQIEVSVSDFTTRCCKAKAKAKRSDMLLVTFMDSNEYIEEDINDWDYIVRRMVNERLRSAEKQGISFVEYLEQNNLGGYGSVEYDYDDLLPGYMMNFGAFGISYDEDSGDYELITPIYYKSFYCKIPEKRDITLSSTIEVSGADIELTIDPGDWEGYYAYNLVSKNRSNNYFPPSTVVDDELHREWAKNWYNEYHRRVINDGMATEEFLSLYCSRGRTTTEYVLYALEDYVLVTYAIDMVEGAPQVVSPLHIQHFQTTEVERADLTVDVEFTEVYACMARFDITPSNNEDSYVAAIIEKSIVDASPESSIIGSLTQYVDPVNGVIYGEYSGEALNLLPETEYVLCVVGTHGNMVTTDLMTFEFTTGPAEPCAVAVENITIGGPYSLHELYEYDSKYVHPSYLEIPEFMAGVCWAEVETSGEPYKIYIGLLETSMFEQYPEEYLYRELMRLPSTKLQTFFVSYAEDMVVLCRLMDQRGNLSEVYKTDPFTFSMEDNRDPSELAEVLDRMNGQTRSGTIIFNEFKSVLSPEDRDNPTIEIIPILPIR